MNVIDIIIFAILLYFILIGLYKGFVISLLSLASSVFSWFVSWIFYPLLSKSIVRHSPDLIEAIVNYTTASKLLNPLELRNVLVTDITRDTAAAIVEDTGLISPFNKLLTTNMVRHSLKDLSTIGQYADTTVAHVIINIISFVMLFIIIKMITSVFIGIISHVKDLPTIKKLDGLLGGLTGYFSGTILLFAIFAFIPILITFAQVDLVSEYVAASKFAGLYFRFNVFTQFVRGFI